MARWSLPSAFGLPFRLPFSPPASAAAPSAAAPAPGMLQHTQREPSKTQPSDKTRERASTHLSSSRNIVSTWPIQPVSKRSATVGRKGRQGKAADLTVSGQVTSGMETPCCESLVIFFWPKPLIRTTQSWTHEHTSSDHLDNATSGLLHSTFLKARQPEDV